MLIENHQPVICVPIHHSLTLWNHDKKYPKSTHNFTRCCPAGRGRQRHRRRVINERGNVSDDVRQQVLHAARALGLKRLVPVSHHRMVRINVILARPELPLIRRMGIEFRRLSDRMDHSVSIPRTTLEDEKPTSIVDALLRSPCDAAVVYAQDHPLIRDAIAELATRSKPVVTMISDLPGSVRLAYAGTDHSKAGRSAGYFLSRMARPGPAR